MVSEESAFWLLAHICEELHRDYFTQSMAGAKADIAALKDLVRKELPRFYNQATDMAMPLELVATKWLIAGFVNSFPPSTALRILEVNVVTSEGIGGVLNIRGDPLSYLTLLCATTAGAWYYVLRCISTSTPNLTDDIPSNSAGSLS